MKTKLLGIFVCMLLIATAVLPLLSSAEKYVNDDCGCDSRFYGKGNLPSPLYPQDASPKPITMGTPDYFSWKDFGGQDWTTPAKDQFDPQWCGSCWIFAALGILESVINIKEGSAVIDPDLSEQYVLSCLPEAGSGCNGGMPYDVFPYIMDTSPSGNNCNGVIWETCFPYQAADGIPCDDKCPDWEDYLVPISDHGYWIYDESTEGRDAIKTQIMQKGPAVACMLWSSEFSSWGNSHHSPDDYYSNDNEYGEDHDIVVLGWKDDPSISNGGYWICKNSAGTNFGYQGFFNIEYGLLGSLWIDNDPTTTYIVWVDYDPESYEWPNEPDPPAVPLINGETSGEIDNEYEYTFNSEDPDNNDVKYFISWGDGNTEWTDYSSSGEDVTVKHTWDEEGTFTIMALAMNTNDSISPWGTLEVTMPVSQQSLILQFLDKITERFPNAFPILRHMLGL